MTTEYRVVHAETAERYFTCRRCGARGEVAFRAEGDSGWQRNSVFVASIDARVHAAAEQDLMHDADRVLHLIRCPTCGERDAAYVRWARIRVAAWFVLGGGLLAVGGLHIAIAAIACAVIGGLQAWREHARFRRADAALLLRLSPGTRPALAAPIPKPVMPPAPKLPPARAITAPPLAPAAPRGPDEEPAFLRDAKK